MEAILIEPHNDKMQAYARCVSVVNDFHKMGFGNRSAFCVIVQEYDSTYKDYHKIKKLHEFWNMRAHKLDMIVELESVVDRLKNE
jgi:hypothetical protein